MHEATLAGVERTNNVCEGWNNGAFSSLVGLNHPSVWTLVHALQLDQAVAASDMLLAARGQPPTKRTTEQRQRRPQTFYTERRDGVKPVKDTLRGVGHCIRVGQ